MTTSSVNVAVRCRPLSKKEADDGFTSIVDFDNHTQVIVHDPNESPSDRLGTRSGERQNYSHVYDFNAVFDQHSTQSQVYNRVCRPIVDSVLEGYNGTIFAYGQTGTGKTYTMEGASSFGNDTRNVGGKRRQSSEIANQVESQDGAGIIPRTFEHIFNHIGNNPKVQFLVRASYMEIYQEDIHDLLKKDRVKLELHERSDTGVYVKNLTSYVCKSVTDIERVMKVGNQNRSVGATDMNEHSSRSHAIFVVVVEQQSTLEKLTSKDGQPLERLVKSGKLNLVDLAGSERQRKTNSHGERQRESIKINLSLSTLGNVINSLMKVDSSSQQQKGNNAKKAVFIPYRDSKLTRLLQDSLGGNSKTLMIANIGPASYNYDETINTLNYASKAKNIKNRPKINEDPKDTLLRELQREIDDLRSKLRRRSAVGSTAVSSSIETNEDIQQEFLDLKQKLAALEGKLLNSDKTINGSGAIDESILRGYTKEQELALERARAELVYQEDRERAIRDELEEKDQAELLAKASFKSIKHEAEAKKKLIRQILVKIKTIKDEINAAQNASRIELDELEQLQYEIQKELRLKCLIMDNFIPNNHVDQLLPRIIYDERRNTCSVRPIDLALDYCNLKTTSTNRFSDSFKPTPDCIRPRAEFEKIAETICPGNMRYKYENLIETKPDPTQWEPLRRLNITSQELDKDERNARTPTLQKLIEDALSQHEPDIVI